MRTTTRAGVAGMLLALTGTALLAAGGARNLPTDRRALARFERAVGQYAELHRRLQAGVPALVVTADPEQIHHAIERLAAAVRTERADAHVGAIFEPDVALVIRTRLYDEMRHARRAGLPGLADHRVPTTLSVNAPFPWGTPNAM